MTRTLRVATRLRLKREVVRRLADGQLDQVAGGCPGTDYSCDEYPPHPCLDPGPTYCC